MRPLLCVCVGVGGGGGGTIHLGILPPQSGTPHTCCAALKIKGREPVQKGACPNYCSCTCSSPLTLSY